MKVLLNPKIKEQGSGLSSTVSFEDMGLIEAMNQCFKIEKREQIEQIEIHSGGWVTARISTKKAEGEHE